MRRALFFCSLPAILFLLPTSVLARDASGIRIETNPVYGASVTLEEGVRVFRPLPPIRHLIINPDGKTPLNVTIEERNIVVRHHYYGATIDSDREESTGRYAGGYWPRIHSGRRHHRHRVHHRHRGGYLVPAPRSPRGVRK